MEAFVTFIAILGALHSHLRYRRIWGPCYFSGQQSAKTPHKSQYSFRRAYKEPPVIVLIVFVIFIAFMLLNSDT